MENINKQQQNILIVDDTPANLRLLATMLADEGYTVRPVPNGRLALSAATAAPPDLILLDINMPAMDGYEVCTRLKANPATSHIPVIFISALDETLDKVKAFTVGGVDYVTKPFQFAEVLARVRTHLQLRRLQRELEKTNAELEQRVQARTAELTRLNTALDRFVPHEFLDFLQKNSITDVIPGDHSLQQMSILFSDIRDFTSLSEKISPHETFYFLNDYFNHINPLIKKHQGFIDKYMGDGVMALFPHQADQAVQAAIAMQQEVTSHNQVHQATYPSIQIGIGIHTGNLILGILGNKQRVQGTVISDAVNLAARLEGLTKLYGTSILISEQTLHQLADPTDYHTRFIDRVQVKGKQIPVSVYEVFNGDDPRQIERKLKTKPLFEEALSHYCQQRFAQATAVFQATLAENPDDTAVQLYVKRAIHFQEHGVPPDWVGVAALQVK